MPVIQSLRDIAGGIEMKFDVALRIYGKKLIPEEITHDLNLTPDLQHKNGDSQEIYSKKGKLITVVNYHEGMWSKKIEAISNENFQDVLWRTLKILVSYKDKFLEYKTKRYKIDLFCGVWYDERENQIIIDKNLLKQLDEINVKVEMDEYRV